ncbi:MAG: class I SAM-dependent methyltransferase [Phycisphaerales bacterium JB039]
MAEASFYDDPSLYDILHAPGVAREVDGLQRIERRFGPPRPGVWLEPACGTGRYLRVAARRGRRVIGFDLSEEMIAYARRRVERLGPEVERRTRLFVADMATFDQQPAMRRAGRGRITFAFNLINTFRHLESTPAALGHLEAMRRTLAPGGIYVLGISLAAYGSEQPSEELWEARRGRTQVRHVAQYLPPSPGGRFEMAHNILVVSRPGREDEVRASKFRLRTYSASQLERLVRRAGFEVAGHVDERGSDIPVVEPGYGLWALRAR